MIALLGNCRRISEVIKSKPGDLRRGKREMICFNSEGYTGRGGRDRGSGESRNSATCADEETLSGSGWAVNMF